MTRLTLRYSAKSIVLPSHFSLYARAHVCTRYNFDGNISSVVPNLRFGESSRRNNGRVCAPNKLSVRRSVRGRSMDTLVASENSLTVFQLIFTRCHGIQNSPSCDTRFHVIFRIIIFCGRTREGGRESQRYEQMESPITVVERNHRRQRRNNGSLRAAARCTAGS